MVNATSKPTKASRRRRVLRFSVVAALADFSVSSGAKRVTPQAGKMPNRQPVAIEASSANASTRASICTSSSRGIATGARCTNHFTAKTEIHTPSAPPARLSRKVSVSIWRMTRARVAPSATRIAASRMRPGTRVRSRPARLAQTISNTTPTAPRRKINPEVHAFASLLGDLCLDHVQLGERLLGTYARFQSCQGAKIEFTN